VHVVVLGGYVQALGSPWQLPLHAEVWGSVLHGVWLACGAPVIVTQWPMLPGESHAWH
jgi:hypothetical protein